MRECISVNSGTRNVSGGGGGTQVCSGRRLGAMFVVVRVDEARLVSYFPQSSLPVLEKSDPVVLSKPCVPHGSTVTVTSNTIAPNGSEFSQGV